jgi:predicted nucleic acid-binding protein
VSGYLLDTTVIIDYAHGIPAGDAIVRKLFEETSELYTCDVVTCEALSRGGDAELEAVAALLDALEYVALAPDGARWAGEQRRTRREEGRRAPGTTDALIAALAHSLGATVVTRNANDFEAFDVAVLGYGYEAASTADPASQPDPLR